MSIPVDLDKYQGYLAKDENELIDDGLPVEVIERVIRFRALYTYWCRFSSKSVREMVEYDMQYNKISESQAYDDIHCIQIVMGNLQEASKKFHRWRVNQMIEEDRKAAKRDGDWRAVASMQKNYILNNQTDKEDTPDLAFDKIVPAKLLPTEDPTVIGIKKLPDLRKRQEKMLKKYGAEAEYVTYQELPEEDKE
jgi:hypothetical protein